MGKPRVAVHADTRTWAWARKAEAYQKYLSNEFDVSIAYNDAPPDYAACDLVHFFEVSQLSRVPSDYEGKVVAGLTANVWRTWGVEKMAYWATRADALHGNSVLIAEDLRRFSARVYYCPNGVDPDYWYRYRDRPSGELLACHVGKPNPRKGGDQIIRACQKVGIRLLLVRRTSHVALPWPELREIYQDAAIQLTMSDMDGTPNPQLESGACENITVGTRIGNLPELVRNFHNGFLIGDPPDPVTGRIDQDTLVDAMADKLAWCIEHPKVVAEMGRQMRRELIKEWTWETQCEKVRTMWREVLAS